MLPAFDAIGEAGPVMMRGFSNDTKRPLPFDKKEHLVRAVTVCQQCCGGLVMMRSISDDTGISNDTRLSIKKKDTLILHRAP